ncbi:hypothetical protein ACRQEF_05170 [Actinotignum sp. GS-2025a]|uniref:hypothetical protein n=1 Tax=Actinotignum sp. GS-2025a TaxID=3427274 RepID=UPI003F48E274
MGNGAIRWSDLTAADARAIFTLLDTHQSAVNSSFRTSREEIDLMFEPSVPHSVFGWYDDAAPGRRLLAFGIVRLYDARTAHPTVTLSASVHPELSPEVREQAAREVLAEQLRRAPALAAGTLHPVAVANVESWDPERGRALAAAGFTDRLSYLQMRRPLTRGPLPLPASAHTDNSGVELVPLTPDRDDAALLAHNSFYADKLNYPIYTREQWRIECAFMRREWSFLAVDTRGDRPRVLGCIMTAAYEQDWPGLGFREGYVDELAVRAESPDGVNARLLAASIAAQAHSGMDATTLDLTVHYEPDGSRLTPESAARLSLYESFGFEVTERTRVVHHPLPDLPARS